MSSRLRAFVSGVAAIIDASVTNIMLAPVSSGTTKGRKTAGTGAVEDLTAGDLRSILQGQSIIIACSDETTALTTGVAKVTFRMPYAFTLTAVRASLNTASSSGAPQFDINQDGASILSTPITIDANEETSTTAATPPVISDTTLADDSEITIDFDAVGTGAKGAKIALIGYAT